MRMISNIQDTDLEILHYDPYSQSAVTLDPQLGLIEKWESSFYASDRHKMIFPHEGALPSVMKSDKGSWWQHTAQPLAEFPDVMAGRFQIGVVRYGAQHWLVQHNLTTNKVTCTVFKGRLAGQSVKA
jgi:hypothetical protein